jgi:hypothetical protein
MRCTLWVWADELATMARPRFPIGPDSPYVAYYASAKIGCFLVLDWPMPVVSRCRRRMSPLPSPPPKGEVLHSVPPKLDADSRPGGHRHDTIFHDEFGLYDVCPITPGFRNVARKEEVGERRQSQVVPLQAPRLPSPPWPNPPPQGSRGRSSAVNTRSSCQVALCCAPLRSWFRRFSSSSETCSTRPPELDNATVLGRAKNLGNPK